MKMPKGFQAEGKGLSLKIDVHLMETEEFGQFVKLFMEVLAKLSEDEIEEYMGKLLQIYNKDRREEDGRE